MRVYIDCTPLLVRSAGIKTYLYHWSRSLRAITGDVQFHAFPFLSRFGPLDHETSVIGRCGTLARMSMLGCLNRGSHSALDWLTPGGDVFHCSNQVSNPPRKGILTATIHDTTCWLRPDLHTPATLAYEHRFLERVLRRASRMIAVSEASRQDAISILKLPPDRVEAIHSGVSNAFFEVTPELAVKAADQYNLQKPYILFVGVIEPRKNIERLLNAYGRLKPSLKEEFDLILAGPLGWESRQTVERLSGKEPGVRYLGYVPESVLPGLTAGAEICVYPSLYEGFGFPIVQAMAAGVPVVTSAVPALLEVAGDSALFIDPLSEDSIREGIERLLLSSSLRSSLAKKGVRRAERYRWKRCAEESRRFFERACGG